MKRALIHAAWWALLAPFAVQATPTPLQSVLTALAENARIDAFEHLDGVTVKREPEGSGFSGTIAFTTAPFQGVAVPYEAFFPRNDATQPPTHLILYVPPKAGARESEHDYVRLLREQLGGDLQVGLLADRCEWDAGGMGPSREHEAFVKVAWPEGDRKLFVEAAARNYPDQRNTYLSLSTDDELAQIDAMGCKPGAVSW